jgi:hypothetical protein
MAGIQVYGAGTSALSSGEGNGLPGEERSRRTDGERCESLNGGGMQPSEQQIRNWIEGTPDPDMGELNLLVSRILAEQGSFASSSEDGGFVEFLRRSSKTFRHFMHTHEHGIEATALVVVIVGEVWASHGLTLEQAHLVAIGTLHAVLQLTKE